MLIKENVIKSFFSKYSQKEELVPKDVINELFDIASDKISHKEIVSICKIIAEKNVYYEPLLIFIIHTFDKMLLIFSYLALYALENGNKEWYFGAQFILRTHITSNPYVSDNSSIDMFNELLDYKRANHCNDYTYGVDLFQVRNIGDLTIIFYLMNFVCNKEGNCTLSSITETEVILNMTFFINDINDLYDFWVYYMVVSLGFCIGRLDITNEQQAMIIKRFGQVEVNILELLRHDYNLLKCEVFWYESTINLTRLRTTHPMITHVYPEYDIDFSKPHEHLTSQIYDYCTYMNLCDSSNENCKRILNDIPKDGVSYFTQFFCNIISLDCITSFKNGTEFIKYMKKILSITPDCVQAKLTMMLQVVAQLIPAPVISRLDITKIFNFVFLHVLNTKDNEFEGIEYVNDQPSYTTFLRVVKLMMERESDCNFFKLLLLRENLLHLISNI